MKQFLRALSAFGVFLILANTSQAQIRVISGNVKDSASGKGMIGVTVVVKGTNTGTYTDQDGNYSLALPANATTLEFKFVGSKTVDRLIGTSNTINVSMQPDVLGLSEVVVTALGISEEKEALGYSTQTVGSNELNTSGTGNPLSELEGKVSGLTIDQSSGDPGAGLYVQLRGPISVSGTNQPLIVVDGVPLDNSLNGFDASNGYLTNNTNDEGLGGVQANDRGIDINPNDIASITVLKGPAASALYGIRAAPGAIIITTKRGNGGKKGPTVDFNTSESFQQVNKLPALQNQFSQGTGFDPVTEEFINPVWIGPGYGTAGTIGNGQSAATIYNGDLAGQQRLSWGPAISGLDWTGPGTYLNPGGGTWDVHGRIVPSDSPQANHSMPVVPYNNANEFFQTGWTEDNNIALSGGNDKSGFRISLGNVNETGVIPLSSYDKTTCSLNGQTNLSDKLSVSGGATYITSVQNQTQQGSNTDGVMLGLTRTPPTFDNANGTSDPANDPSAYIFPDSTERTFRGVHGYDNPFWTVNRNPAVQDLNRIYGYGQVDYKPLTWLSITYRLGADVYQQDEKQAYDVLSSSPYYTGGSPGGALFLIDIFNKQFNSDIIATATHDFSKDLSGSLMLGQNYFTQYTSENFMQGYYLEVPDFFTLSNATTFVSSDGESTIRRSAWYGQAQLAYKSQLFLTVTGRDETSSTLPASDDAFFYPSADLGWVFTEPLGLANNSIFPYGKLRLSYADVGNDAPAEALLPVFSSPGFANGWGDGFSFPYNGLVGNAISYTGSVVSIGENPTLKPENTSSFEGGFDLAFLKNRIGLNVTYYNSTTDQDIIPVPVSAATGFGYIYFNAAQIQNKGVEVTLNLTPFKQKNNGWRWDLQFNWSANSNVVENLSNGVNDYLIAGFTAGGVYAVKGQPYGVIYGTTYVTAPNGQVLINDQPTIQNGNGQTIPNPAYGLPQVTTTNYPLGTIQPKWIGSAISTLSFKNFALGFQINVRDGGLIWDGTEQALEYYGTAQVTANRGQSVTFSGLQGHISDSGQYNGQIVHYVDGVEVPGAGPTNNIKGVYSQYYYQEIAGIEGATSAGVYSGSFIRLGEISLTYAFSQNVVRKMHLYGLSLTVFAVNPYLYTKYPGVDPETSVTGPSSGQGIDYFNNPDTRSYGIRLNLSL